MNLTFILFNSSLSFCLDQLHLKSRNFAVVLQSWNKQSLINRILLRFWLFDGIVCFVRQRVLPELNICLALIKSGAFLYPSLTGFPENKHALLSAKGTISTELRRLIMKERVRYAFFLR